MRVAILRRFPQESFSMDVYADALVRGLKKVRPDWKIIELAPALDHVSKDQPSWMIGLQKYYERYWRYPLSLNLENVDLFHIIDHSDGYLCYWLNRYKRPNVVTCHDLINLIKPETFKGRARFPLISMTAWQFAIQGMRKANHIITVSSHTKKDTINCLQIPPNKIAVIPNAVDPTFHPTSPETIYVFRQQQHISSDTVCMLNVGSNNARKNISTLLEVVAALRNEGFPIHFWKVGADFNNKQKYFIKENALNTCITYLGQPDEETLITIYNAADVLVAPSLYEGFGLTVIEAMACGTAVVASNITSLPEVAGDAAILTDPLDVKAIVEAIRKLHHEPAYRQELVHKGLKQAGQFTWQKTAEQVAKVYETTLAKLSAHSM